MYGEKQSVKFGNLDQRKKWETLIDVDWIVRLTWDVKRWEGFGLMECGGAV